MVKKQCANLLKALPLEIILKITSRLPIKSIINCMRVCKLWRSLISNPFLAKYDSKYSLLHYPDKATFVILEHSSGDGSRVSKDHIITMKHSYAAGSERSERMTILGSCNGLICFSRKDLVERVYVTSIHVYNPAIEESITVPRTTRRFMSSPLFYDAYAFGFCPTIDRYKILRWVEMNSLADKFEAEIYTLGSEGWRRIVDAPRDMSICAGGVIHWLLYTEPKSILTFNLEAEEFKVAPPPPLENGETMFRLGYMDGCLIVTSGTYEHMVLPSRLDIWVRKESPSSSLWIKSWVVRDLHLMNIHSLWGLELLIPMTVSTDGQILLISLGNGKVYSYDPKDGNGTAYTTLVNEISIPCSNMVHYGATHVSPRDLMKGRSLEKQGYQGRTREDNQFRGFVRLTSA